MNAPNNSPSGDDLDFTLDDIGELSPDPAHRTRAYSPNATCTVTPVKVNTQARQPNMLQAALKYAARGWHVFPVHVPIFNDAGACIGCTCEDWKRTQPKYGPDYKCPQPGKCPAVRWAEKSTAELAQCKKWWGHQWKTKNVETGATFYYTPNIGIDCGKSGLLVLDEDAYKQIYGDLGDLLSPDEQETVRQLSGSHKGSHLLYAMPEGKAYGNAVGSLPDGIDVRGVGGYIVAEPSLHKSGNRYEWPEGYSPDEIALQTVPEALQAILDDAQAKAPAQAVTFTTPTTEAPQLGHLHLTKNTKNRIFNPDLTGDRSKADMQVVVALVDAGATDDEILAVFEHCPIGVNGKFAEAGRGYLAHTISKARVYVEAHPRPNALATIALLRLWNRTHDIAALVGPGSGRRCLRKVVDSWCDLAEKDARLIVNAGNKLLAKLAGVDKNSVRNAFILLNGVLFDVTPGDHGAHIALVDNCRLQKLHPALSVITGVDTRGEVIENDKNSYSPHKADDAFATGVSRFVKNKVRDAAQATGQTYREALNAYTAPGLGEGVLLACDTAQRLGDMTAQEYAAEAGIKLSSARAHLRRAEQRGLAESHREGSRGPKVYTFVSDFWPKIEEMTPDLRTFNRYPQREAKRIEGAQQWTKAEQEKAEAAGDKEQALKLERRFNRLATERRPHLERLHPDLSDKEITRLAYEVAAYKRSPKIEQAVKTARQQAQEEHALTVACMLQCLTNYANQTGTLPAMPTGDEPTVTIEGQTFERAMVADVLRNPSLVKRTMQGVEEIYAMVNL